VIRWLLRRDEGSGATVAPKFVALTDLGLKREENQDAVLARRLPDGRILLAVADGVGGSEDGAAASKTPWGTASGNPPRRSSQRSSRARRPGSPTSATAAPTSRTATACTS